MPPKCHIEVPAEIPALQIQQELTSSEPLAEPHNHPIAGWTPDQIEAAERIARDPEIRSALFATAIHFGAPEPEEVVQDSIVDMAVLGEKLDFSRAINLARVIAQRTAIDQLRKISKRDGRELAADTLPDVVSGNQENEHLDRMLLEELLAELPQHSRGVLRLIYFAGYKYRDLAEEVGIPFGTIATAASDARKKLKARLAKRGITGI